jgi:hypothetical protein
MSATVSQPGSTDLPGCPGRREPGAGSADYPGEVSLVDPAWILTRYDTSAASTATPPRSVPPAGSCCARSKRWRSHGRPILSMSTELRANLLHLWLSANC